LKQFKEKNSKKKMIYVVGIGIIFFISVFLFYKSYVLFSIISLKKLNTY